MLQWACRDLQDICIDRNILPPLSPPPHVVITVIFVTAHLPVSAPKNLTLTDNLRGDNWKQWQSSNSHIKVLCLREEAVKPLIWYITCPDHRENGNNSWKERCHWVVLCIIHVCHGCYELRVQMSPVGLQPYCQNYNSWVDQLVKWPDSGLKKSWEYLWISLVCPKFLPSGVLNSRWSVICRREA